MTTLKALYIVQEPQRSRWSARLTNCQVRAGKLGLEEQESAPGYPCLNSVFIKCQLYARYRAEEWGNNCD